ncbi:conserved hypothetical protein [uncultured Mycobacterium sp.]|uniref:Uncharacterized protein n=1 Tax=uncultured Mycobacterium sp. TaxID=171292 RepID=A0A1Y5P8Y3_9MYCO|nr:conserved hypothetical protein [uncultured Mycobacterium sp.]
MTAPFLGISDFTTEYQGTLSTGETTTATRLLQVVSDGIRGLKPDVDTEAAKQVLFEVVRDAMMYGDLGPLSSFQNITSKRQVSGAFDEGARAVIDYLTTRQRKLLGLDPVQAAPRGYFPKCDY